MNFRLTNDATAQFVQEIHDAFGVAFFADTPAMLTYFSGLILNLRVA